MITIEQPRIIRSLPCPTCPLCGASGKNLYNGLEDRLFGAWGKWNFKKCPDPQCGLAWLDPMPRASDIHNAYSTYYTHTDSPVSKTSLGITFGRRVMRAIRKSYLAWKYGYHKENLSVFQRSLWPLAYLTLNGRVWLDSKVMYLQAPYKGRLLEIGAGSGDQLRELIEFGWDGEGLDNDANAVDNAIKKGLRVRCGTVEAQHYPPNSFHAIIMNHVIEHVHEPLSLLQECRRILRTGGQLVIVTPNMLSMGHRLFKSSWFPLDPPRHLRVYTPPSLRRIAEKAGFRTMKVFTTARNANGIFWTSRSIRQSGKCEMNAIPKTSIRFLGWVILLIESLLLKVNPFMGEEIAALLTKEQD